MIFLIDLLTSNYLPLQLLATNHFLLWIKFWLKLYFPVILILAVRLLQMVAEAMAVVWSKWAKFCCDHTSRILQIAKQNPHHIRNRLMFLVELSPSCQTFLWLAISWLCGYLVKWKVAGSGGWRAAFHGRTLIEEFVTTFLSIDFLLTIDAWL